MRTKRPLYFAGLAVLIGFFGFLTYRYVFVDQTAAAMTEITKTLQPFEVATASAEVKQPPEYYGAKRAEIALTEYRKNVIEVPRGCNCGPEIDKYTEGNPAQWCTMFASWVAYTAGSPLIDERSGAWRFLNSRLFTEHLKIHGTFYSRDEIIAQNIQPRVGDFVIFWRGNLEDNLGHIDTVVAITGDGRADLVGGNIRDRVEFRKDFPYRDNYGFLGIGRPEKE
jgi:hypothetical protein